MTTELIEFEDTKRVLSEALDEALKVFCEKADVRPMVGMVALLDGIVERCIEIQPEATEQLLAIHHRAAKDRLLGELGEIRGVEEAFEHSSAMHLLTVAMEKRVIAHV